MGEGGWGSFYKSHSSAIDMINMSTRGEIVIGKIRREKLMLSFLQSIAPNNLKQNYLQQLKSCKCNHCNHLHYV